MKQHKIDDDGSFFKKRARLSTPEAHAPGRRANEAASRGTQEKKRAYSLVSLPRFMTTCSPELPNTDLVDPLVPAHQVLLEVPLVLEVLWPQEGLLRL